MYINSGAFKAFHCTGNTFRLDLSRNRLSAMSGMAFYGIESCLLSIDLSFNELVQLPVALNSLRNLTSLSLLGNSLLDLDLTIMATIGMSLTDFRVDMRHFSRWPSDGLRFLSCIKRMDLIGIPVDHLDEFSFQHVQQIKELTISESNLRGVPRALCNLTALRTLNISNNHQMKETGYKMFDICEAANRSYVQLENLFFYNNKASIFPNFMAMFPNVRKIGAGDNDLDTMNEEALTEAQELRSISLDNNVFVRLPFALNKYATLTYISLEGNRIASIEEYDLAKLSQLMTLDLDENPIKYITHNAFANNPQLSVLYLSGTSLQQIPHSVTLLPRLSYLTLTDTLVECTCNMPYLGTWTQAADVNFRNAMCYNRSVLIETFVSKYEQFC